MEALELAVVPLDVARRTTMRLATRSAFVTRVLARRDSRIACLASLQIALLFALTLRAPVALFFVGPLLFGVAHLAADVRYLVLHRAPPRGLVIASAAFALAITAVEVGARLRVVPIRSVATIEVALGVAWVGLALAVALRGRALRALVVAPLFLAAAWFVVGHARAVGLVLIHAHNAIAVLAWLVLFRRRVRWAVVPVALLAAGTAVLVSGTYLPWTFARGGGVAFGTQLASLGTWLAPGARPALAIALASSFVFLQGVHYAAWIGWIPQDDLVSATEGTPTFRMSVRALGKDFGPIALAVIALAALGFAGVALWSVQDSVGWYMTLAKSHAWFEGAFFGYFLLRGERRRTMAA